MKKMWMVAAVVCAALMVACGGEKKAEKKADAAPVVPGQVVVPNQDVVPGQDVAATSGATAVVENPVVAKATETANQLVAAIKAGNMSLAEKIATETDVYFESLSEADQAIFEQTVNKIAAAAGMMDETVPVETIEPVAATSGATTVAEPVEVEASSVETTEPVAANPTVVAKATELANKMVDALKSGNESLAEKVSVEAEKYFESLSEADQVVFEQTVNKIAAAAGLE